ncbi:sulfite exporter TauE/SafE family protein [Candidatus Woesearchaeota archaeon]|nr:sulfite exporter TauE/SafE family protein [Candidatus Woesearchaeota archaeon]
MRFNILNNLSWAILLVIATFILVSAVSAQSNLPIGLQKIIDYNTKSTEAFALKVTLFIAFVAGILGILSPCILLFLPAYFAYTFKEKRRITLMTLVFFAGFSIAFVSLGVIAGFLGSQLLSAVQTKWIVTVGGIFIIIFGSMTLLGKGFSSFIKLKHQFKGDIFGMFLFGIFFALGWTACLGPILAGILGIGAIIGSPLKSALLLFFYSLGNLLPLFTLAMLYDKFNLAESKLIQGKIFSFSLKNKTYEVHSTNLISGIFFIIVGLIMLVYEGTGIINAWDIFGTKQYFYTYQNKLINWSYANIFGIFLFFIFMAVLTLFLWKRKS